MSTHDSISRVLLLGGGAQIVDLAAWVLRKGKQSNIITAPRHAAELVAPGKTLLQAAAESDVRVDIVEDIAAAGEAVGDMSAAIAISLGAAWIFKPQTISLVFNDRLYNIHGTRLPQNRGGGGWSWQVLTANRLGFNLLHKVDGGVDTGDIVAVREFLYPASCRIPQDYMRVYFEKNFAFLTNVLEGLFAGTCDLKPSAQPEYLSTYWPRLNTDMQAWIDWSWSVEHIDRFVCAFDDPYAGARTFWNEKPVRLKGVMADYNDLQTHPFQSGIVFRNNGEWLCIACSGGALIAQAIIDESGANVLSTVKVGDSLHTPAEFLAKRAERVIYTPRGLNAKRAEFI